MNDTSLTGVFQPEAAAIDEAAKDTFQEAVGRGDIKVVTALLVRHPGIIECENSAKSTGLIWAISSQQEEMAQILIQAGANIHHKDNNDWTPLIWAASKGMVKLAGNLIQKGAALEDHALSGGETPLIMAGLMGKADMAEMLLEAGADINAVDSRGRTALQWAEKDEKKKATADIIRSFPERQKQKVEAEAQCKQALTDGVAVSLKEGLPDALKVGKPLQFR